MNVKKTARLGIGVFLGALIGCGSEAPETANDPGCQGGKCDGFETFDEVNLMIDPDRPPVVACEASVTDASCQLTLPAEDLSAMSAVSYLTDETIGIDVAEVRLLVPANKTVKIHDVEAKAPQLFSRAEGGFWIDYRILGEQQWHDLNASGEKTSWTELDILAQLGKANGSQFACDITCTENEEEVAFQGPIGAGAIVEYRLYLFPAFTINFWLNSVYEVTEYPINFDVDLL